MDAKRSLWTATATVQDHPPLPGAVSADVAVLGGGIVGITTAMLLQAEGLDVAVIEAARLGHGVTGHTTAKISSLNGTTYASLTSRFGQEAARTYGEASEAGLARIARFVEELAIDCDFRRRANYTYAASPDSLPQVEEEAAAALAAGLPATFTTDVPLPYETAGAVRFDDQAEFHPLRYVAALAAAFTGGGGRIFEGTRAHRLHDGAPCRVETEHGTVTAAHVIVVTHFPFPDRGLFFARMHPERSYAIAVRIEEAPPEGMFINSSSPTRSIRAHPVDGEELLLVGGEGHKVGQGGATEPRYRELEEFARRHWAVRSVDYRWSAQDNMPADGLPFIGKLTPRSQRSYVATGFRKWGLAMGTSAAMMLADRIASRTNPWAALFDPGRLNASAAASGLVKENVNVGFHFVADRVTERAGDSANDLEPGTGKVVSRHGRQIALSKDEGGRVHAVSARCTHMGCIVSWNDAERSWDCPCHGSRFAPDGSVVHGPAVDPLGPRDLPS